MGASLAAELYGAAKMFIEIRNILDVKLRAEHSGGVFTPDPMVGKPQ
jgi:hypothetical protein